MEGPILTGKKKKDRMERKRQVFKMYVIEMLAKKLEGVLYLWEFKENRGGRGNILASTQRKEKIWRAGRFISKKDCVFILISLHSLKWCS